MRILFATDGSRGAAIAEDFLLSLPLSTADDVIVLTAPLHSEREAYALLSRSRWRFASRDIPASTMLREGHAAEAVASAALERAPDLVVVGSRGLGTFTGALLGSVARSLVREAPVPVLVIRAGREAPRRVVLAIDGSADARASVDLIARFPLPGDAGFTLLHVVETTRDVADENPGVDLPTRVALRDAHEQEGLRLLAHARALLGARVDDEDVIDSGHVGEQLLQHAIHRGAELIVLAARGHTHGAGLLGASTADHVMSNAHCAVLVGKSHLAARSVVPVAAHALTVN